MERTEWMSFDQRRRWRSILALVIVLVLVNGCGINLATSTKKVLEFNVALWEEGVTKMGEQLTRHPIPKGPDVTDKQREAARESRKPYIEALKALEEFRLINNAIVKMAQEAKDKGIDLEPEDFEDLENLRWSVIVETIPLLLRFGVTVFQIVN